jgi:hypothetical protein
MVLPQPGIHAEQIALTVVLLLEILRRLKPCHPAELVLADHVHAKVFRFSLLLTLLGTRAAFRADDDERRLRGDLVSGGSAKADDERLRFLAAEG